jgi:hypothetical protein
MRSVWLFELFEDSVFYYKGMREVRLFELFEDYFGASAVWVSPPPIDLLRVFFCFIIETRQRGVLYSFPAMSLRAIGGTINIQRYT